MDVVSLFSGGGTSSFGYKMAGHKVLCSLEFIDAAVESYRANFPDTHIIHDDIRNVSGEDILKIIGKEKYELDVLDGSPPCFIAGTLINTKRGFIPIEDVVEGDYVLTHKNRYRRVYNTMWKNYSGDLYNISACHTQIDNNAMYNVTSTPEHPFYARKMIKSNEFTSYTNTIWIDASDLNVGDYLTIAHENEGEDVVLISCSNVEIIQTSSCIVYNISVEDDESYTANGLIVHNCASFSMAGKRDKLWGKEKKYSDKRQRTDDLFFEFIRVAEAIMPKFIVNENVKGMTVGKSREVLAEVQAIYDSIGYDCVYRVLNAKDYGAPQARERVIIVCIRKDIADTFEFGENFKYPKQLNTTTTVKDAIENIVNDKDEISMLLAAGEKYANYRFYDEIEPGSSHHIRFNLARNHWDRPSMTLLFTDSCLGAAGICHPFEKRRHTIAEAKALMGLPVSFKVTGTWQQQYERLARGVCPQVLMHVSQSIETFYNEYKKRIEDNKLCKSAQ